MQRWTRYRSSVGGSRVVPAKKRAREPYSVCLIFPSTLVLRGWHQRLLIRHVRYISISKQMNTNIYVCIVSMCTHTAPCVYCMQTEGIRKSA
jgi:hypothetical protein